MESGLNKFGFIVNATYAFKNEYYECIHCAEKLILNKGKIKKAYFSHEKKSNRTPFERTCPEYKEGNGYTKISNEKDIIYIKNGGVPLVIERNNDKFELRAYFPKIKTVSDKKDIIININKDLEKNKYRKKYIASNIEFYQVKTIQKWIYIEANMKNGEKIDREKEKSLVNKWLWGIRGIDIERDIYSLIDGSWVRVALKSNITVGKKYIVISSRNITNDDIIFNKIGSIILDNLDDERKLKGKLKYYIFEMEIKKYSEMTRRYIESKGYTLSKSEKVVVPIWPPYTKQLKEIESIYEYLDFYVEDRNSDGNLNETIENIDGIEVSLKDSNIFSMRINKEDSILKNYNKDKIISKEILFNLNKIYYEYFKKTYEDKIEFKILYNNKEVEYKNIGKSENFNRKMIIISKMKIEILVKENGIIIYNSSYYIDRLDYGRELIIIVNGERYHSIICENKSKEDRKYIDINELVRKINIESKEKIIVKKYRDILDNIDHGTLEFTFILNKILYEGIPIESKDYIENIWREINEN